MERLRSPPRLDNQLVPHGWEASPVGVFGQLCRVHLRGAVRWVRLRGLIRLRQSHGSKSVAWAGASDSMPMARRQRRRRICHCYPAAGPRWVKTPGPALWSFLARMGRFRSDWDRLGLLLDRSRRGRAPQIAPSAGTRVAPGPIRRSEEGTTGRAASADRSADSRKVSRDFAGDPGRGEAGPPPNFGRHSRPGPRSQKTRFSHCLSASVRLFRPARQRS